MANKERLHVIIHLKEDYPEPVATLVRARLTQKRNVTDRTGLPSPPRSGFQQKPEKGR